MSYCKHCGKEEYNIDRQIADAVCPECEKEIARGVQRCYNDICRENYRRSFCPLNGQAYEDCNDKMTKADLDALNASLLNEDKEI